jgi:sec1 family domain-containing protein 1
MLSHSWTYQALIHDVLDLRLNRIVVEVRDWQHRFIYSVSFKDTKLIELIGIV